MSEQDIIGWFTVAVAISIFGVIAVAAIAVHLDQKKGKPR